MKTSHIYPGASSLSAYITLKDCKRAIEFYKKAFDAKEKGILLMPDGKVAHAELEIEGSLLMMADENLEWGNKCPETIGGNPMSFGLYVKDVDKAFQKAIDAGAKSVMPVEDMFYGDRTGQVLDPFGYKWMLSTHKEDVSYAEMQKRSDKMFAA
ncbi:MAG: VOC family protein, partial [Flavobacterium sp.]